MKMVVTAQSQLDTALQKWMDKGGKVEILEDGTWAYTNSEGITIKYIDGFPDFKEAGLVRQEVEIGEFKNYAIDFKKANMTAPLGKKLRSNTWHHHEDLKTLQEVNKSIHAEFTHRGGVSPKERKIR